MKFEVVNRDNRVVMSTEFKICVPDNKTLNIMSKAGYKLKLNGRTLSVKKIQEQLKEVDDNKNN